MFPGILIFLFTENDNILDILDHNTFVSESESKDIENMEQLINR